MMKYLSVLLVALLLITASTFAQTKTNEGKVETLKSATGEIVSKTYSDVSITITCPWLDPETYAEAKAEVLYAKADSTSTTATPYRLNLYLKDQSKAHGDYNLRNLEKTEMKIIISDPDNGNKVLVRFPPAATS
ncbi:MAG: hypothetical protein ACPGO5_01965 [Patescibacteria group bacterium]